MYDQPQLQLDIIMQKFHKIKSEYTKLKSANTNLEEAVEHLKQRLIQKEKQKCDLIALLKKIVNEHRLKLESLQKENNHLQSTMQEQNQMIEDYLKIIEELKKKSDFLTKENTKDNDKQRDFSFSGNVKNAIKQSNYSKNENDSNNNLNNFTHPSLNNESKPINKSQKKSKNPHHLRWQNLDIIVDRKNKIEDNSVKESNAIQKENGFFKFEKRRKLYRHDDETVDLEHDDD